MTTQQGRLQAKLQGRCLWLEGRRQGETLGWPCPPFAPGLGALTPSAASARRHPCNRAASRSSSREATAPRLYILGSVVWGRGAGREAGAGRDPPGSCVGRDAGRDLCGRAERGTLLPAAGPHLVHLGPAPGRLRGTRARADGARARSCLWGRGISLAPGRVHAARGGPFPGGPAPRSGLRARPPARPSRTRPRRPAPASRPRRPGAAAGSRAEGRAAGAGGAGGRGAAGRGGPGAPSPDLPAAAGRRGGPEAVPGGWASWEWHGRVPGEARPGRTPAWRARADRWLRRGGAAGAARRSLRPPGASRPAPPAPRAGPARGGPRPRETPPASRLRPGPRRAPGALGEQPA